MPSESVSCGLPSDPFFRFPVGEAPIRSRVTEPHNPGEYEDQIAALRAQFDQAVEAAVEMARAVWAYYDALCEQGFTSEQSLALVSAWQTALLSGRTSEGE